MATPSTGSNSSEKSVAAGVTVLGLGDGSPAPTPRSRRAKRAAKAKAAKAGAPRVQPRNTDVYLTWPFGPACGVEQVETACPHDRAHAVTLDGRLAPAATVAHARPRRYPRSLLNGAGLSIDSAADAAFAREARLARDGVIDESAGEPGVSPVALETARRMGELEARCGRGAVRRLTRVFGSAGRGDR